jgi:hypothetical protein
MALPVGEHRAQKLSITVPDSLHARLEMVRDGFNISYTCQKAIELAVKNQELLKAGGTENVIQRLRIEKEEHEKHYRIEGKEEGLKRAPTMGYGDLMFFNRLAEEQIENEISLLGYSGWDAVKRTEWEWNEDLRFTCRDIRKNDPAFNDELWIRGFIEGVNEFYESVKGKL